MDNIKKIALPVIMILLISIAGCVYNGPETTSSAITAITAITPAPAVQTHDIGQSVSDGNSRMTLNNVRYTQEINEKKNESGAVKAESGRQFLIINITIENISPDKNMSYNGYQFLILDSNGYIYEEDVSASKQLAKGFNGNKMAPGDRREGELSFQIPANAIGLKLRFEYSPESSGGLRLEFFKMDR